MSDKKDGSDKKRKKIIPPLKRKKLLLPGQKRTEEPASSSEPVKEASKMPVIPKRKKFLVGEGESPKSSKTDAPKESSVSRPSSVPKKPLVINKKKSLESDGPKERESEKELPPKKESTSEKEATSKLSALVKNALSSRRLSPDYKKKKSRRDPSTKRKDQGEKDSKRPSSPKDYLGKEDYSKLKNILATPEMSEVSAENPLEDLESVDDILLEGADSEELVGIQNILSHSTIQRGIQAAEEESDDDWEDPPGPPVSPSKKKERPPELPKEEVPEAEPFVDFPIIDGELDLVESGEIESVAPSGPEKRDIGLGEALLSAKEMEDLSEERAEKDEKPLLRGPVVIPKKSIFRAYLLWFFLGWMGGHRYYAGKWISGLFYTFSLGFLFMGWAVDLFLVPFMIKEANKQIEREAEEYPHWFASLEFPLAPWAQQALEHRSFAPLKMAFVILGPFIFVLGVVLLNQLELAFLGLIILGITGFMGSAEKLQKYIEKYPALEKLPVVGDAVETMKKLYQFYYENKPRSILFYAFYPITAPISLLLSSRTRREMSLYSKILLSIGLVAIIETLLSYSSLYPPFLTWRDALWLVFLNLLATFFVVTCFMMPMVSTAFSLNFSGHHKKLRTLTAIALVISISAGIHSYLNTRKAISFTGAMRLSARLDKDAFRKELKESVTMFLRYYLRDLGEPLPSKGEPCLVHPTLTEKFRRHISSLAVADESNAFTVIVFHYNTPKENTGFDESRIGLGIKLVDGTKYFLLYLMDGKGKLYSSWEDAPSVLRSPFVAIEKDESGHEWKAREIMKKGLLTEYIFWERKKLEVPGER